ncbi:SDR family oxidoreductase [Oceanicaulis alexandrii]|uniref:SDR family oxidoreductase n=1 Tax=Oceanicaulis alexandrii TaxID=153233 RepID=UPI002352BF6B|nr:SDR family oxidoreductase [Oceanicaulis alexandrii]
MRILIAGATGHTGRALTRKIQQSGGTPVALVRESSDVSVLPEGVETRTGDLTALPEDVADSMDAVIFAAGSGGDTPDALTDAIDRDGAISLIEKAKQAGVQRFVMLSTVGADQPERGPEALRNYLKAKGDADAYLETAGIDFTIVRPVALTHETGAGQIEVSAGHVSGESISREDVAEVLERCVSVPEASGAVFELSEGSLSIGEAMGLINRAA